ncbi:MAG: MFS transporter [Gammaproteobacteria bacterium SHHR-1]|uniref:magnetosome biogenesis transporter MamH n=1 Tax=Magnetovirga frankeli TaxID=947516 RepID=UPI0032744A85
MTVENHYRNTLYLISALCMIFMTMILALQPVYLRVVLGVSLEDAGAINANVQVLTEVLDLLIIGYMGHLSDVYGRVRVVVWGFVVAGIAALIVPYSLEVGLFLGIGGLAVFYLMRIVMSLGTTAVTPQLAAVTGDFSDFKDRAPLMSKMAFMMAFGATLVYAVLMQMPRYVGLIPTMLIMPAVAFIGAWLAHRYLIDLTPPVKERKMPWREGLALIKADRRLRLAFLSAFSSRNDLVLIGLFLMLWFVYFADVIGMGHEEAAARGGALIGLIGLVILISIPVWGWFIQRFGRMAALAAGLFLSGIGFISMAFVVNPYDWGIYVPALFMAVGQAGTLIAPQVLTIDLSPPPMRGFILGAFNTIGGIGMIFFVQIGGFLFDWIGPYAPFVFTGIGNLLIMLYALWLMRVEDEPEAGD